MAIIARAQTTVASAPGTGGVTFGGAVSAMQTWAAAGAVDGSVYSYLIEEGVTWEYGRGTYSASGTLSRTTILGSSNGNAAVNFGGGAIVSQVILAPDMGGGSGSGRLVFSSTSSVLFIPVFGNQIIVNGTLRTIPSGGFNLPNTGLAGGTIYYVYLPPTGTTLEASTTGHVTGADGTEVKNGDASRAYLGMVYMNGTGTPGTFNDTVTGRYVCSWFNPIRKAIAGAVNTYNTTSTSEVELSTAARSYFLSHAGQGCEAIASGYGNPGSSSVGYGIFVRVSLDNDYSAPTTLAGQPAYGSSAVCSAYSWVTTEGLHYFTARGYCQASGTTTQFAGGVSGSCTG